MKSTRKKKRKENRFTTIRNKVERGTKRRFLCKEPGGSNLPDEEFTIEADDLEDAREQAGIWNAVVIKEIKK